MAFAMSMVRGPMAPAFTGRTLRGPQQLQPRQTTIVNAAKANWWPGKEKPSWLDENMPGNFGFDPFALAKDPAALKWYQQGELQNGRWAMLGVAGILVPNLLGSTGTGGRAAEQPWFDAGAYPYFAPSSTLFVIELFMFAWVELRRLQDYNKPGSTNQDPIFKNNKLPDGNEPGYPGGIFDPLGWSKGDLATLKLKEIKNGRLAMLSFAGFVAQYVTTGKTPLENLADHLADPWKNNVIFNELKRAGIGGGELSFSPYTEISQFSV